MEPARADHQIDLPPLDIRAAVTPDSINEEDRSFEVIFSTGAPVPRGGFFSEPYIETLSMDPKHIRLDRINSGAPFLNAHSSETMADQIGVVVDGSARVQGGKAFARIRMAKDDADADRVWNKIRQRIARNISVGFLAHRYEETRTKDGQLVQRHAVDWEPYEVSAVPMPADNGAKVRAKPTQTNPCVLIARTAEETVPMEDDTRAAGSTLLDPQLPVIVPAPPAEPDLPGDLEIGRRSEQERIQGILSGCEAARLPMAFAQDLIKRNVGLLEAQTAMLNTLKGAPDRVTSPRPGPSGAGGVATYERGSGVQFVGADPLENVWRGIGNALLSRVAPQYFKLEDIGRPYQSRSALAFVELCLHHRGISTVGMTKNELASSALGYGTRGSGFHSTSDFANILIDATNKVLRQAYLQATQTFEAITRRMTLSDFKTMNLTQLGEAPTLLEVKEHGEFTRGTMTDSKETLRLKTYGRVFSITRQALINDDLNAFGDIPTAFGRSARQKESDLVWEQITSNPLMGDGFALFSTQHGNLDSSGNAIDDTVIGEGFAAMRMQKGLDGLTPLNTVPRYLIVPVAKEALALKYTTQITPATGATVNPYASRLTVITEPRLDANSTTAWYLVASTDEIPIIALAFLDGQDGPMVETRTGFEIDGIEIKCRHDVAAKVIDHRGLFKNVGA